LGQFERDLICERTRAGLDAATARGRQGGRKPVVTHEKLRRAQTLLTQGLTVREVAARVKVGKTALYAALARCPVSSPSVRFGEDSAMTQYRRYRPSVIQSRSLQRSAI
jgi:DNA invertase Pin-like site-specific DNA recombinase